MISVGHKPARFERKDLPQSVPIRETSVSDSLMSYCYSYDDVANHYTGA